MKNISNLFYVLGSIVLIVVFGFFIFSQKHPSVSNAASGPDLVQVVDGKQIVKMTASAAGYSPNNFKIKANIPVVWQITSSGNAGCAGSIVSHGLFSDRIDLIPNSQVTKEFTPVAPGTYRFSCTMGMYTGTFEVIN